MVKERLVEVGDLIIQKGDIFSKKDGVDPKYYGIVTEVKMRSGTKTVFIRWSPHTPPEYDDKNGYAHNNIHNCTSVYEVVKKGVVM